MPVDSSVRISKRGVRPLAFVNQIICIGNRRGEGASNDSHLIFTVFFAHFITFLIQIKYRLSIQGPWDLQNSVGTYEDFICD